MTLLSPGTEVTVIDESFFAPVVSTSIPYVLLATAQDKTNSTGDVALGTTAENANVVTPVTSRRELVTLFGNPAFTPDAAGGVVQAHELNEYGLQTAYSLLGVTNRVYVQRVDVDLGQLSGTTVRPTDSPANGTIWYDTTDSIYGIFEWNAADQTFNEITPIIISSADDHSGGVPNAEIGSPGDFAVVTVVDPVVIYHKGRTGTWVLLGATAWHSSSFTVQGTVGGNPTITAADDITINTITVGGVFTGTALSDVASDINGAAIPGVTAGVSADGKLELYATELAESDGATADGQINISAMTGTFGADVGLTVGFYAMPDLQMSAHTSVPEWKAGDDIGGTGALGRPTGSVWIKTTTPNNGADWVVSTFNGTTDAFDRISTPLYLNDAAANFALDAVGGGQNVAQGAMYVRYDTVEDVTASFQIYTRAVAGDTVVTIPSGGTFASGDEFTVAMSVPASDTFAAVETITTTGVTAATFVTDIVNKGVANLTAEIDGSGNVLITHTAGGTMILKDTVNTPLVTAGLASSLTYVEDGNDTDFVVSNWVPATYTVSLIEPSVDPADGTQWYYSDVDDVDIMYHNGTIWTGYQSVGNTSSARNEDLTATDPLGPIVSASEPTVQSDASPLVIGDLWIDTSDIDNYPILNRYEDIGATNDWVTMDTADGTSEDGIIFADARWDGADEVSKVDTVTGDYPTIVSMLTSDEVDLDAPDPALYPRGMLLWNTRRSGFNVKQYAVDYFNSDTFTGTIPNETNTWRTVSGLQLDGSPYMGSGAVRNMVVQAMKAGIDGSITVREETTTVNILSAPGYPELMANLVKVNTDRKETSFVVGDSPMKLSNSSLALTNWASNANLATDNGEDGLVTVSEYLGVYYPAGLTNDLDGNAIVMPSSHMALRTMIKSDNVSYPWIAPAGLRRGKVDNATSIGYVDSVSGEFQSIAVGEGLRDVLYTNNVNPISVLPGSGVTVWGQKTRAAAASSLDRINVARLTANLRWVLTLLSRPFIFEPNDKLTRDEFKNEIEKYLNELVTKRGIFDYLVVCDESNNTPSRIDRNELWADVAIEPVKAAEFIFIPLRLKNTGEI